MNLTHEDLQTLIARGAFELYGQPKWTFGKNTCNTYEVMAEVIHLPDGKTVSSYDYIKQIVTNEQTTQLFSDWFLVESLSMMRRLIDRAGCDLITAVKAWGYSINQPDFVDKVRAALDKCGLEPRNLEFELRAVDAIDDTGIANLEELKHQGVSILLDNFGIGTSNLYALIQLPINGIKLAKCFAAGLPNDDRLIRLLVSIAHMADTLGITVCVKGIENGDQFEHFSDLGFLKGQGYMIGAPLPEKELLEFILKFAKKD